MVNNPDDSRISGNLNGVAIDGSGTSSNLVQGNYIGTDLAGLQPRRNANAPDTAGVRISGGASPGVPACLAPQPAAPGRG